MNTLSILWLINWNLEFSFLQKSKKIDQYKELNNIQSKVVNSRRTLENLEKYVVDGFKVKIVIEFIWLKRINFSVKISDNNECLSQKISHFFFVWEVSIDKGLQLIKIKIWKWYWKIYHIQFCEKKLIKKAFLKLGNIKLRIISQLYFQ